MAALLNRPRPINPPLEALLMRFIYQKHIPNWRKRRVKAGGDGMDGYVIAYDFGTTGGVKTCVLRLRIPSSPLPAPWRAMIYTYWTMGGAEQDPEQWWKGMCVSTKKKCWKKAVSARKKSKGFPFVPRCRALF